MSDRVREWGIAGAIGLIVVLGLVVEAGADDVERPVTDPAPGPRFVERAVFCPPSLADSKTWVVASSAGSETVLAGIEPARRDPVELLPGRVLVHELRNEAAADVVGYGSALQAGAVTRIRAPLPGEGAAPCAIRPSSSWYFAAGSSILGADERLLLYNPFPDEAVVRVSFVTPGGERTKAGLSDVPVPAKSSTTVRVNDFIRLQRSLGVKVATRRGRIVAWKVLLDEPDDGPRGIHLSLGAASPAPTWYFPEGRVGQGAEERIAVMNPGEEEALVTITLTTSDQIVQPPSLVELAVAPQSSRVLSLADEIPRRQSDLGGVSVVVQSTNDTGVIAERWMSYPGAMGGVASETGLTRTSSEWALPPAVLAPAADRVIMMNPDGETAKIALTIVSRERRVLAPASLSGRKLGPGDRMTIDITRWTRSEPTLVRLTASAPVVAERLAYSSAMGDVGGVMGIPLQ